MYPDRVKIYNEMEKLRQSKILAYISGDRPGMETQIHSEVLDYFTDHIDLFNLPVKISLILYSRGGETLTGWSIVNLIRHFCKEFEVIIPSKAHSAATLISIGANKIVMTKQATLGPIDPSINNPLNPQIPGAPPNARLPISVEDVAGYFELARKECVVNNQNDLATIFLKLADNVHPVALGSVFRARTQIQMLAEKLLRFHMNDDAKIKRIISVLCSESGSHDYTINRREAENDLGLPIEKPNTDLYNLIKSLHIDFRKDLELNSRFDPNVLLGGNPTKQYSFTRSVIESIEGGSHKYMSEGTLTRQKINTPTGLVDAIQDQRNFEGWKYENPVKPLP